MLYGRCLRYRAQSPEAFVTQGASIIVTNRTVGGPPLRSYATSADDRRRRSHGGLPVMRLLPPARRKTEYQVASRCRFAFASATHALARHVESQSLLHAAERAVGVGHVGASAASIIAISPPFAQCNVPRCVPARNARGHARSPESARFDVDHAATCLLDVENAGDRLRRTFSAHSITSCRLLRIALLHQMRPFRPLTLTISRLRPSRCRVSAWLHGHAPGRLRSLVRANASNDYNNQQRASARSRRSISNTAGRRLLR